MSGIVRFISAVGTCLAVTVLLSACGNSNSSTPSVTPTATNVALASAGATITTNIAGGAEVFVTDGSTDPINFWQAVAVNDTLTIDFGAAYAIESVNIVATSIGSTANFSIEYSTDNATWTPWDNVTACGAGFTLGASGYTCEFGTIYNARYFRYTALTVTTPQIHEIEIMGL